MNIWPKVRTVFGIIIFTVIVLSLFAHSSGEVSLEKKGDKNPIERIAERLVTSTPTPTPYQFPYKLPEISKNRSYRIVVVGDSMVEVLGPNADLVRRKLIERYPENEFVIYNYGQGSTNVLSLPQRLTEVTIFKGTEYVPILKQGFEVIIIESFGYNPLSEYSLEEGLKKQTEVLDESVRMILKEKPDVALLFMTPIAPHPTLFARSEYKLTQTQRMEWVKERIAYIDNHRKFAKEREIPVIDVYDASLNKDGGVNRGYISEDYVHPSTKGMDFMSKIIADYFIKESILPK